MSARVRHDESLSISLINNLTKIPANAARSQILAGSGTALYANVLSTDQQGDTARLIKHDMRSEGALSPAKSKVMCPTGVTRQRPLKQKNIFGTCYIFYAIFSSKGIEQSGEALKNVSNSFTWPALQACVAGE